MAAQHSVKLSQEKGFITLLSVLIIGAVGVSIAVSLLLMGIDASKTVTIHTRSEQAKGLANACAEAGLQQIRNVPAFTGSNTLTIDSNTCTYEIIHAGGQNRTINSTGTVENTIRKVQVQITQINPSISVSDWHEISDF